jgi:hypothetical protein
MCRDLGTVLKTSPRVSLLEQPWKLSVVVNYLHHQMSKSNVMEETAKVSSMVSD